MLIQSLLLALCLLPRSEINCQYIYWVLSIKTFNTDIIVFVNNAWIYLTSHWTTDLKIKVNSLILMALLCEIKEKNVHITDKTDHHNYIFIKECKWSEVVFIQFVCLFVWWCLMPLSTIFRLHRGSQFNGGGNRSTRIKPLTYRKSLTNFITCMVWVYGV